MFSCCTTVCTATVAFFSAGTAVGAGFRGADATVEGDEEESNEEADCYEFEDVDGFGEAVAAPGR